MNNVTESIVTIAVAIVGVAIVAVLFSKRSNTAGVIGAAGQAFTGALGVAVSPIANNGGLGYGGWVAPQPTFGGGGLLSGY